MRRVAIGMAALALSVAACGDDTGSQPTEEPAEAVPFNFRSCMEAAETPGDENTCINAQADIETILDRAQKDQCRLHGENERGELWGDCWRRLNTEFRAELEAEVGRRLADD